jgi:hypothetical protein
MVGDVVRVTEKKSGYCLKFLSMSLASELQLNIYNCPPAG